MSVTATQTTASPASGLGLRTILQLDAATGVVMGLLLTASAGLLSVLLGLPEKFVFWAGVVLLPCAALMMLTSRLGKPHHPPRLMTWLVILGNAAWVVASFLTITLWFSPTVLGVLFVGFQGLVVLVFTLLEYRAL